jgi:DNA-binding protein H-NS
MATLAELQEQLDKLTAKVEAERARVRAESVNEVKQLMLERGLTLADLAEPAKPKKQYKKRQGAPIVTNGLAPNGAGHDAPTDAPALNGSESASLAADGEAVAPKAKTKGTRPAKYLDPKTGATWSGMGHTPAWLVGKKREKYLIAAAE